MGRASKEQEGSEENKDEDEKRDVAEHSRRRRRCMSVQVHYIASLQM
jgi:hypothetical protein